MITKYKLFTTPTCPSCPAVKEHMNKVELDGTHIDATTPEGATEAGKHGIMSVPTVLFLDDQENIVDRAQSIKQIEQVLGNAS